VSNVYFQRELDLVTFRATVTLPQGSTEEVSAGVPSEETEVDGRRVVTFDYEFAQ